MRTNYRTPWSNGAALIAVFTTLGTLVLGGIIVSAVWPHTVRPNPRIAAEQQRSADTRLARLRADPCIGLPLQSRPSTCPGRSAARASGPLAARVSELESRVNTLENDQ